MIQNKESFRIKIKDYDSSNDISVYWNGGLMTYLWIGAAVSPLFWIAKVSANTTYAL